jgi:hypothetical protein
MIVKMLIYQLRNIFFSKKIEVQVYYRIFFLEVFRNSSNRTRLPSE